MAVKKDGSNIVLSTDADKVIFAVLGNKQACKNYSNCISGTFSYKGNANAILVYNGKIHGNLSAHGWLGYPDTCILRYKDGTFAVKRLVSIPDSELPKVHFAISGMGMLDMYAPEKEGYCKFSKDGTVYDYSDVRRKTNHTAIGIKDGKVYGFYLNNMTAEQANNYISGFALDGCIMLDGGHVAAVNCDEYSANASQKQHNIVQFVMTEENETAKDDDDMSTVKVYSLASQANKAVSANFKVREYRCKDGSDAVFIHPELAEILQKIRTHFGRPVTINSAFRTPEYNKKVGGESLSQHLYGRAADIAIAGVSPKKVAEYAETLLKNRGGIGIYPTFTHIDVRSKKARW